MTDGATQTGQSHPKRTVQIPPAAFLPICAAESVCGVFLAWRAVLETRVNPHPCMYGFDQSKKPAGQEVTRRAHRSGVVPAATTLLRNQPLATNCRCEAERALLTATPQACPSRVCRASCICCASAAPRDEPASPVLCAKTTSGRRIHNEHN